MSKTYNEIVSSMKSNLGKLRTDVETTEGTVVADIFEAIADEIEDVYVDIEHINVLGSFLNWDKMSKEELDDLAFNYGIVRKAAVKSSGYIYFRTATTPTTDIYVPAGLVVTTEPDENLQTINLVTTDDNTLDHTIASSYYNSTSGYYEIAVPIEAVTEGTTGNIGVGMIKVIQGSVSGVQNIYNYSALTNGTDEETNEDLADRCLLAIQGASVGTEAGYIAKVLENVYVYDALVVGPGDTLMIRDNGNGGKIDIYIKVDEASTGVYLAKQIVTIYAGEVEYIFDDQPVKSIISIVGSIHGTFSTAEYTFVKDTGNLKGSNQALDKIVWIHSPTVGETVTINFNYFNIIETLTTTVEDVRPITADVLVRLANKILIDITATVNADSTITDKTTFNADVITEIQTYLTYKSLNGKVEQSDIVNEIYNVDGVDSITIPLTKMAKSGQSGVADIDLTENEYSYPGTITITVP